MKCPVCHKQELVSQSLEDSFGSPDLFCPEVVIMPGGKCLNHYREFSSVKNQVRIIVLPYRIITQDGESKVSLHSRYKTGGHYFKTILQVPAIHPDSQEKLLNRIKLLLLLS